MIAKKTPYVTAGTKWIDITRSGQSYGIARYKIDKGTLYVYLNKTTTNVTSWQTVANLPQDVYSKIDIDNLPYAYIFVPIFNDLTTYAVGYIELNTGIIQMQGNTSATTIMTLPYNG